MDLREKLVFCEKYIKGSGYSDAEIIETKDSEMVVFHIGSVSAKYPHERPTVSVSFANGSMNGNDIGFDVMQILCFLSSGVPDERLTDLRKFCADFNKTIQIGHFDTDLKNESVYYHCAQIIRRDISGDELAGLLEQVFSMVLFYFGYAFEVLIELSYGVIGYRGTSKKMLERQQMITKAMAEIEGVAPTPKQTKPDRNLVLEELLSELKKNNPDILEQANIDMDEVRIRQGKTKKQVSAEEAAKKIMNLAQTEKKAFASRKKKEEQISDQPLEIPTRNTVTDTNPMRHRNQLPSVEMYAQREKRKPEPPLDMEALRKALELDQKERARIQDQRRENENLLMQQIAEETPQMLSPMQRNGENNEPQTPNPKKRQNPESLVQRLRNWTQN